MSLCSRATWSFSTGFLGGVPVFVNFPEIWKGGIWVLWVLVIWVMDLVYIECNSLLIIRS